MTRGELFKLAKQAGGRFDGSDWRFACDFDDENLARFAELVAAKERARLFGADRQLDGQMRLQLTRWEGGECFAAAAHFSAEQTHFGPDSMLQLAVDQLDEQIDAGIDAAIRARGTV